MANTFTNVLPVLFSQGLLALREACVMPRLVNTDFANTPAGTGDTVNVTISSALTVSDVTPSAAPTTPQDSNPIKVPVQLSRWRKTGFHLTDKQRGEIFDGVVPGQVSEAMKVLGNDVNTFLYGLYKGVFGSAGTAGTTPFAGADLTDAAAVRAVLNKQLAPLSPRRLVFDVNADANLVKNPYIAAQYARGNATANALGQYGGPIMGMDPFMDQGVLTHTSPAMTAGAATVNGVQTANAGSTDNGRNGTLSIAKATNATNLIAGDLLQIATGPAAGQYVVTADVTLAVGNTTVAISPALRGATAGGETITKTNTHVVNLAFHRDAFAFASRVMQSDSSEPGKTISMADPVSGIALRLEVIRQNKQDYYEWDILYGATLVRPEMAARLLG